VSRVIVMPEVSAALGAFVAGRGSLIAILNRLYDQLENHVERYRSRRDAEDEALFDYDVHLFDGAGWHTLRFSVDDSIADDRFFVVAVSHRPGKVSM
jgi:hypothetical protein